MAALVLLVAAISVYLVIKYSPEKGVKVMPNSEAPAVSQTATSTVIQLPKLEAEKQPVVESYIRENINDFSPVRAASGTSWSVTSLNFLDFHNAEIEYTDGQSIRKGTIGFSIDESNQVILSSLKVKSN